MKKVLVLLLMLTMSSSLLAGCGDNSKSSTRSKDKKEKDKDQDDEEDDDEDEDGDEDGEEDSILDDEYDENQDIDENVSYKVVNNNSYFVQVDNRVYYREYGVDALENPTVFYNFLKMSTGGSSSINYYDIETGENVRAFDDNGMGNIIFIDGVFIMTKEIDNYFYTYAVDMDGNKIEEFQDIKGSIGGLLENDIILMQSYDSNNNNYRYSGINKDGEVIFETTSDKYFDLVGVKDNHCIYRYVDYGNYEIVFYSSSFEDGNVQTICLGSVPITSSYAYGTTQYITSDNTNYEYVSIDAREGSGMFLAFWKVVKFDPNVEGSLTEEIVSDEYEQEEMPYYKYQNGELIEIAEPNSYSLDRYMVEDDANLYYYDENGKGIMIYELFSEGTDYYSERQVLLHGERVGDDNYIMRANVIYDENGSVGWRDGFRLLKIEYLRIDKNNNVQTLAEIEY